jgi:GTP cyclohydrolase I
MSHQSPSASEPESTYDTLEHPFHDYLQTLTSNKDLGLFQAEYEKLFKAFLSSNQEKKKLSTRCLDLEQQLEILRHELSLVQASQEKSVTSTSPSDEIESNPSSDHETHISTMALHYTKLIEMVGEDPSREGIVKTPQRASKAFMDLTCGYRQDLKVLLNEAIYSSDCSEMVLVKEIELYSLCEHHLLPFTGKCHVAYIPQGKVIGLSKVARIVDMFARRMQIQENLTLQIAQCLMDVIGAAGVAVTIEAEHMCMRMRGVGKQNSVMVSSTMLGTFKEDRAMRAEYLSMIKK